LGVCKKGNKIKPGKKTLSGVVEGSLIAERLKEVGKNKMRSWSRLEIQQGKRLYIKERVLGNV